eukprot:1148663-Pelagomonas_calceolata.AAC.5
MHSREETAPGSWQEKCNMYGAYMYMELANPIDDMEAVHRFLCVCVLCGLLAERESVFTWNAQSAVTMQSRVPSRTSLMEFSSFSRAILCCKANGKTAKGQHHHFQGRLFAAKPMEAQLRSNNIIFKGRSLLQSQWKHS